MKLSPIILAGGGGTRLWPLSREHYPKQFLSLFGDNTLLQNTLLRLDGLSTSVAVSDPVIICNEVHRFLVAGQTTEISRNISSFILEPIGRNTAPALTIAALQQVTNNDDAVMIMMPADHSVKDIASFQQAIAAGVEIALDNKLVTFGIKPNSPETGYGYIHVTDQIQTSPDHAIHRIGGFKEKPNKDVAEDYLKSGDYLWNSGVFMMKATVWLEKIKEFQPAISQACIDAFNKGDVDGMFYRLDETSFSNCPDDSIDYAVMEKLAQINDEQLAVIPIDVGWSDVGAWASVWEISDKDSNDNYYWLSGYGDSG
jgi:mannose-1-phosphate guanylyltransferase/mannose-6-phosphate isomerase